MAADGPIILFDGVCNLCTASVRFVVRRDRRKRFRFASLQSDLAQELLRRHGSAANTLDSVILLTGGRAYRKSGAALRIAARLDGFWPALSVLLVIPSPLRDAVYDWIGRRRYRWFGRKQLCWTGDQDVKDRFIDR